MIARYHVLVSDDLMDADPSWPPMLRPIEPGEAGHPGARWWLFEDDDADETLNGKRVNLTITTTAGLLLIERKPLP